MKKILRVHFPGSEIIMEPSGKWDVLELDFLKLKGSREESSASNVSLVMKS